MLSKGRRRSRSEQEIVRKWEGLARMDGRDSM